MEIKLTFEEQGFKGHVIIDTVSTSKRFRVMKEFGLTPKNISEDVFSDFGVIADLIDKSKEYYKKVDLKKGNKSYKSFDDLGWGDMLW